MVIMSRSRECESSYVGYGEVLLTEGEAYSLQRHWKATAGLVAVGLTVGLTLMTVKDTSAPAVGTHDWARTAPSLMSSSMTFQSLSKSKTPSDCAQAAAELSAAYLSTQRFTGSTTAELQEYLATNGVIVSVCVNARNNCSTWNEAPLLPDGPEHWSGSWISSTSAGGIYPGVGGRSFNVGVVANPRALTLRCIYPTDGATSVRDDGGCGPFLFDTEYGSRGAARLSERQLAQERAWMQNYTRARYPGKDWRQIECDPFFADRHFKVYFNASTWRARANDVSACEAMKRKASDGGGGGGDGELRYESLFGLYQKQQSAIYGAPLCTDHTPALGSFWEYVGECSWAPNEWQSMVDAMNSWFSSPDGKLLWNELVAPKPASLAEEVGLVRAVFYMVTPSMNATVKAKLQEDARKNVQMYSQVPGRGPRLPLLEMDTERFGDGRGGLFRCVE